ncbi:hypothetical protein INS49_009345 [Diaporthe citri]|uniref:uncharacterized protein n=1 Tax=Diaporthe citri TaxID=83186 RepID=UPI001C7FE90A|nr:uncharacterized protein INS49_009345 [Diaporthe citri]KAG6361121.1 hypothetical protein INS49_009345 [Diaporthe citri]
MEGRQGIKHTGSWVAPLIQPRLSEFIRIELTEYGWFSTNQDNAEVASNVTHLFLSLYVRAGHSEAFHVLFDGQAQTDFALEISTKFLSLDPAPNDPNLRSFVGSIFSFYQDIFWEQRIEPGLLEVNLCQSASDGSSVSDNSSVISDIQDNKLISNTEAILVEFFKFPGEIRNMIYKEILIAPEGTRLRSFTPPPLLCASRRSQIAQPGLKNLPLPPPWSQFVRACIRVAGHNHREESAAEARWMINENIRKD